MNAELARLESYVRGNLQASPDEVLKMIHATLEVVQNRRATSQRVFEENMDRVEKALKEMPYA